MTGFNIMHHSKTVNALQHLPYALRTDSIATMQKRTVHGILADLISAKGISQTDLHRATGVPQSTISRILKGAILDPADKHVAAIAEYFGVTTDEMRGRLPFRSKVVEVDSVTDYLAGRNRPREEIEQHQGLGDVVVWDDGTPLPDDEVALPLLKEVELSAGSGRTVIQESSRLKLRFGKYTLRNQGVDPANAKCVLVSGNSMEPVLRGGSTVGVDQSRTTISDGDMYAINHDGQLRVKQVYRLPGGGIRLRSFNRDEHPDEEYSIDQMHDQSISIIGRVFWGASFY
jgi:phage repressor protein C with HTH and peptisase S24 domain